MREAAVADGTPMDVDAFDRKGNKGGGRGGGGGDPYSNLVNGDDNLLGHNHSQSDNFRQRYGSGLF